MRLLIRNVHPWGGAAADLLPEGSKAMDVLPEGSKAMDVLLEGGRIAAAGPRLPRGAPELDGGGGLLLPGLHDHHLHILALAARRQSVSLAGLLDEGAIIAALAAAPPGPWVRAVDYDERAAGLPDAATLDRWLPGRPLRLQDRTGALRVLNSAALAQLAGMALPPGAERDSDGCPTGRFWREDRWLGAALPQALPDLAALGAELAGLGLCALTDATAHNGPAEAAILAGAMPQRLVLMGSEALLAGTGYSLGPLKLLIDERDPPALEQLAERIGAARRLGRAVAAHCVTEAELALYLAALAMAGGPRRGDRIEHGGMIPPAFVPVIADAGLAVVTNPAFIHDRGERYRATVPPEQWGALYPAASLARAGIALAAGSDAPYASVDPWRGIRAARDRRTAGGALLGEGERLDALSALRLYCAGRIEKGQPADLILLDGTLDDVLDDPCADRVRATIIGGRPVFGR
ncbi:amidohydrolase family protein [Sandaracinobacteroides sp. A072]|uniref:amidohydrolase family protein n=1 Tax=Sandaracinobacteroides sp. A072 TaxID=3461146 RepID=UPI0040437C04